MHNYSISVVYIVPPFDVTISQDCSDPLYTGTNFAIHCKIELNI